MSDTYYKARVLLLNESTGETLGECEIISDSQEIFYTNEMPMPNSVGNIPAGTTFDKASLAGILDGILYDKICPSLGRCILSNGDIEDLLEERTVVKPLGSTVDDFMLSLTTQFGSHMEMVINLHVITDGVDNCITKEVRRLTISTTSESTTFEIGSFYQDTDIWIEVIAGTDRVVSPRLHYKFASPVWVGWVRSDIINERGELDRVTTQNYFRELIDHNSKNLDKRYVDKSNQNAYVVPDITYVTREYLSPCILIPQSWGELRRINDINGNNIINHYARFTGIDINTHDDYIEHYIVYVSRQNCANDNKLIGGIIYITEGSSNDVNLEDFIGNGIPSTVGFTMHNNVPLDDRVSVKTYEDLLRLVYPYPGLQSYVIDINTTFRFEKGHWMPFNNKFHVVESLDELTEDLGGWDDLAINAYDGKIWKKRYNNQWERYGDIKAEDGVVTFKLNKGDDENG